MAKFIFYTSVHHKTTTVSYFLLAVSFTVEVFCTKLYSVTKTQLYWTVGVHTIVHQRTLVISLNFLKKRIERKSNRIMIMIGSKNMI